MPDTAPPSPDLDDDREAPALTRALRAGGRASTDGFDWPDLDGVRQKVDEELAELDAAIRDEAPAEVAAEIGDLLFTLANLSRFLGVDPEAALDAATRKFERRYRSVVEDCLAAGRTVRTTDAETLDRAWRRAKEAE